MSLTVSMFAYFSHISVTKCQWKEIKDCIPE